MFITLSLGILLLVAYERYKVISNPFQIKRLYKGLISGWLSIIYFVSVLLVTPYALALKIVNYKKRRIHTCTPNNMDLQFFFAIGNVTRDITRDYRSVDNIRFFNPKSYKKEHLHVSHYYKETFTRSRKSKTNVNDYCYCFQYMRSSFGYLSLNFIHLF